MPQPDKVTNAKVRQAAASGGVHPESLDTCAQCFIEGAVYVGLGAKADDGVDLSQPTSATPPPPDDVDAITEKQTGQEKDLVGDAMTPSTGLTLEASDTPDLDRVSARPDKPVITLSLKVDPTSDPEKLEK